MFIRGRRKAYNFIAVKWDGSEESLKDILKLTGKKSVKQGSDKSEDCLCYDKAKGILSFYAPEFGYMAGILNEIFIRTEDNKFNILPETTFYKNFDVEDRYPKFNKGEPVIYQNGDRFELGIVKSVCDAEDEYFINYHTGETASRTHARNLHKICNVHAFEIKRNEVDN